MVEIKRRQKFVSLAKALVVLLELWGKPGEESALEVERLSIFWAMVGLRLQQAIVTLLSRQLPCLDLVRDWARNRNLKVVLMKVIVELLGREPPTKGLGQCKGTV